MQEQYSLKSSIEELQAIQASNLKKINDKKTALNSLQQIKHKEETLNKNKNNVETREDASTKELGSQQILHVDMLKSGIEQLQIIYAENEQIKNEMLVRMKQMDRDRELWVQSIGGLEQLAVLGLSPEGKPLNKNDSQSFLDVDYDKVSFLQAYQIDEVITNKFTTEKIIPKKIVISKSGNLGQRVNSQEGLKKLNNSKLQINESVGKKRVTNRPYVSSSNSRSKLDVNEINNRVKGKVQQVKPSALPKVPIKELACKIQNQDVSVSDTKNKQRELVDTEKQTDSLRQKMFLKLSKRNGGQYSSQSKLFLDSIVQSDNDSRPFADDSENQTMDDVKVKHQKTKPNKMIENLNKILLDTSSTMVCKDFNFDFAIEDDQEQEEVRQDASRCSKKKRVSDLESTFKMEQVQKKVGKVLDNFANNGRGFEACGQSLLCNGEDTLSNITLKEQSKNNSILSNSQIQKYPIKITQPAQHEKNTQIKSSKIQRTNIDYNEKSQNSSYNQTKLSMMRDIKKKKNEKRDGLGASEECFVVKKKTSMIDKLDRDGQKRKVLREKQKWNQAANELFQKQVLVNGVTQIEEIQTLGDNVTTVPEDKFIVPVPKMDQKNTKNIIQNDVKLSALVQNIDTKLNNVEKDPKKLSKNLEKKTSIPLSTKLNKEHKKGNQKNLKSLRESRNGSASKPEIKVVRTKPQNSQQAVNKDNLEILNSNNQNSNNCMKNNNTQGNSNNVLISEVSRSNDVKMCLKIPMPLVKTASNSKINTCDKLQESRTSRKKNRLLEEQRVNNPTTKPFDMITEQLDLIQQQSRRDRNQRRLQSNSKSIHSTPRYLDSSRNNEQKYDKEELLDKYGQGKKYKLIGLKQNQENHQNLDSESLCLSQTTMMLNTRRALDKSLDKAALKLLISREKFDQILIPKIQDLNSQIQSVNDSRSTPTKSKQDSSKATSELNLRTVTKNMNICIESSSSKNDTCSDSFPERNQISTGRDYKLQNENRFSKTQNMMNAGEQKSDLSKDVGIKTERINLQSSKVGLGKVSLEDEYQTLNRNKYDWELQSDSGRSENNMQLRRISIGFLDCGMDNDN